MAKGTFIDGLGNLRTLKYAHTSAVEAYEIIVVNGNVLIAVSDADADEENIYVYAGRAAFPKGSGAIATNTKLYWDPSAGEAKTVKGMAAGSAVVGSNTGNGTVSGEDVGASAVAETWTLTCVAEAENGGTFSVVGSVSGRMADASVGVAYDNGFIEFTIADGAEDFDAGDTFTIAVTQANTEIGVSIEEAASSDTEVAAMLKQN